MRHRMERDHKQARANIHLQIGRRLEDVERDLILGTLARCGGNRTWAADILGVSLERLRESLHRYQSASPAQPEPPRPRTLHEKRTEILERYDPGFRLPS